MPPIGLQQFRVVFPILLLGFACGGETEGLQGDASDVAPLDASENQTSDAGTVDAAVDDPAVADAGGDPADPDAAPTGTPLSECPTWEVEISNFLPSPTLADATVVEGNLHLDVSALSDDVCPATESFCYPVIVSRLNVTGNFDISIDMSNYSGPEDVGLNSAEAFIFFRGNASQSGRSTFVQSQGASNIQIQANVSSFSNGFSSQATGTLDGLANARFTRVGDQLTIVGTRSDGATISASRTFPEGPGRLGVAVNPNIEGPTHIEFGRMTIHTSAGDLLCDW